ncbi:MAG TPA: molybdate ABC transporter substrate-binding protein [Vicinamibacterales bacterium]|nr:molybdate ABC transporter substrate-binding protein [Vicinamibacterales bacterium]
MRLHLLPGLVAGALALGVGAPVVDRAPQPRDVLVFAAASLKTALDELAEPCRQATGAGLRASYAASSTLAKQLEEGAPAELFISADVEWMDYVADRHLIREDTRVNLVGNDLVLIAPASHTVALTIAPGFPLAAAIGRGRLAVGDPAAVPAGLYAKAALTSLGVWDAVAPHLASAENVRAALLLVSRGEAPLGIVYRTDAKVDPGVVIVDTFPDSTHPPIVYPAALTARASAAAASVLDYLRGPAARATFARQGFRTDVPPVK